jgi:hypothetical protein
MPTVRPGNTPLNPVALLAVSIEAVFAHCDDLHRHAAIRRQQPVTGRKESVVVVQPHGFEHLNADQLVERALQIPIVLQQQFDPGSRFSGAVE